ncbi:MAG: hypothetical protein RLZZ479_926 [Bacteroidota bacterium]
MYKILNKESETVAYIQNMMILNKKREKVEQKKVEIKFNIQF